MLPTLMTAIAALLIGLGVGYLGQHIAGDLSYPAVVAFAVGITWLSQAPAIALRKRVRELESKLGG